MPPENQDRVTAAAENSLLNSEPATNTPFQLTKGGKKGEQKPRSGRAARISAATVAAAAAGRSAAAAAPAPAAAPAAAVAPDPWAVVKSKFAATASEAAVEAVGNGPGATPFISNQHGSNHHIYPKSHFINSAKSISRWLKALNAASAETRNAQVTSFHQQVSGKAGHFHFTAAGGTANGYSDAFFWPSGLLFEGVRSGDRVDDPGSNEERLKPNTLPADRWDKALAYGRKLNALSGVINGIGNAFTADKRNDLVEALDEVVTLSRGLPRNKYYTKERIGEDWKIPNATHAGYFRDWGTAAKKYAVNESNTNAFVALGSVSQFMIDHISEAFSAEKFGRLTALPHPALHAANLAIVVAQDVIMRNNANTALQIHTAMDTCLTAINGIFAAETAARAAAPAAPAAPAPPVAAAGGGAAAAPAPAAAPGPVGSLTDAVFAELTTSRTKLTDLMTKFNNWGIKSL